MSFSDLHSFSKELTEQIFPEKKKERTIASVYTALF